MRPSGGTCEGATRRLGVQRRLVQTQALTQVLVIPTQRPVTEGYRVRQRGVGSLTVRTQRIGEQVVQKRVLMDTPPCFTTTGANILLLLLIATNHT